MKKRMKKRMILLFVAILAGDALAAADSEFHLPPVFSDHAVLQQGVVIPVWGDGPNMAWRLSCRVGNVETWTHTDIGCPVASRAGSWEMKFYLPPLKPGGPYEMVLSNLVTHASHVVRDVYVGEVWLASGQSNMAFTMKDTGNVFPESRIEFLRIFDGRKWVVADTNSVMRKSAVATYFGYELQKAHGGAVGVLSLSCGGTLAENWMSRGALKRCPTTRAWTDEYELGQSLPETWVDEPKPPKEEPLDPGPAPETRDWAKLDFPASDWVKGDMPDQLPPVLGFPFNGAGWVRKQIEIPEEWAGRDLLLRLPAIDKHDITFFNGVEVGRTGKGLEWECWETKRVYSVPGKLVKAGRAVLAIRIWSHVYGLGFSTGADHFSIAPKEGGDAALQLEGEWLVKMEVNVGNRSDDVRPKRRAYVDGPSYVKPSVWYDRALKPVIPFPIRGAVWYQGESNVGNVQQARDYRMTLAAMIRDWRDQWGLGDFPVGIVQLANFFFVRKHVVDCPWAELRFAQLQASRDIPNCGLVNAIDLGEELSIHPKNKRDVGRRLVRWAMSEVYGDRSFAPYTGPRYLSGSVEDGAKVRIRFSETEGGLVRTAPVECAFIRAADGVWHSAEVAVDGETLLVSSPDVLEPVEVRYAWSQNPIGATLRGKTSGLPVFPFRWQKDFQ